MLANASPSDILMTAMSDWFRPTLDNRHTPLKIIGNAAQLITSGSRATNRPPVSKQFTFPCTSGCKSVEMSRLWHAENTSIVIYDETWYTSPWPVWQAHSRYDTSRSNGKFSNSKGLTTKSGFLLQTGYTFFAIACRHGCHLTFGISTRVFWLRRACQKQSKYFDLVIFFGCLLLLWETFAESRTTFTTSTMSSTGRLGWSFYCCTNITTILIAVGRF